MPKDHDQLAADALRSAASYLDCDGDPKARDWPAFFAALAAFAEQILPLILPLVTKTTDTKK